MNFNGTPASPGSPRRLAAAAIIALSALAVDTSCAAPPHCPAGQHAQRAPSHQGHMWDCARNGQS